MKILLAFIALLTAAVPASANEVRFSSEVFVERVQQDAQGKSVITLEPPKMVTPGDKLLFILSYKNEGAQPATDLVINNPLPDAVSFAGTESEDALLSIDGGKNWGRLDSLKITEANGTIRPARPEDVTHVKWQFARAIPPGGEGKVSFRGVVK